MFLKICFYFIFQWTRWRTTLNWRGVSSVMATSRESVVKVEPPEIDDTCENQLGENQLVFSCSYCPKQFIFYSGLIVHELIHTKSGALKIPGKNSDSNLNIRITLNSPSPTIVNVNSRKIIDFNIDVVKKEPTSDNDLSKKSNAKSHPKINERIHTDVTPYSCIHRAMNFTTKGDLMNQEQVHYSCPHCHKKFNTKYHLKQHEPVHTGDKPCSCSLCDKKFTDKSNLKRHEPNGDRPYSCSLCDKKFTRKGNLKQHEQLHNDDKPYSCSHCDKKFTDKSNLKRHALNVYVKNFQ